MKDNPPDDSDQLANPYPEETDEAGHREALVRCAPAVVVIGSSSPLPSNFGEIAGTRPANIVVTTRSNKDIVSAFQQKTPLWKVAVLARVSTRTLSEARRLFDASLESIVQSAALLHGDGIDISPNWSGPTLQFEMTRLALELGINLSSMLDESWRGDE